MDNNFEIVDKGNSNVPSTENQNSDIQNQSSDSPKKNKKKKRNKKKKVKIVKTSKDRGYKMRRPLGAKQDGDINDSDMECIATPS